MKSKNLIISGICITLATSLLLVLNSGQTGSMADDNSPELPTKSATEQNPQQQTPGNTVKSKPQCKDYLLALTDIAQVKQAKSQIIRNAIQTLKRDGVDEAKIDHVALRLGIGVVNGRQLRAAKNKTPLLPEIAGSEATLMDKSAQLTFLSYFYRKDLDGLLKAYQNGSIPKSGYIQSSFGTLNAIGQLLSLESGNGFDSITPFIQFGVSINHHDLLQATRQRLDVTQIKALFSASGLKADRIFKQDGQLSSLATVAVATGNTAVVDFWLAQDSPATPDPFTAKVPPQIPQQWQQSVTDIVDDIRQQILKGQVTNPSSNMPQHQCFVESANQLVRLVMPDIPGGNGWVRQKSAIERNTSAMERLAQAKGLFNDRDSIIAELGKNQDLIGKLAIRHYLAGQKSFQTDSNDEQPSTLDETAQLLLDEANDAIGRGNFNEGQEILAQLQDRLSGDPSDNGEAARRILNIQVATLLDSRGSFKQISKLLDQGAQLPANALFTLIQNKDRLLTQQLLNYGLELHYVDNNGQNGLYYSVLYRAPKMLSLLIDLGVSFKPSPYGFDALDQAISQFNPARDGLTPVSLLIDGGAPIQLSHRQLTHGYQRNKPATYNALIEAYPQLLL